MCYCVVRGQGMCCCVVRGQGMCYCSDGLMQGVGELPKKAKYNVHLSVNVLILCEKTLPAYFTEFSMKKRHLRLLI